MPGALRRRISRQGPWSVLSRSLDRLREWRQRSHGRRELAALDERMLRDIGLSQADVWREVNKPFWRK